jgi:hypothetical protein
MLYEQVLWFNFDKRNNISGEKAFSPSSEGGKGRDFRPLQRAFTGDFGVPVEEPLEASDVVFLDPNWLMGCIKTILARDLVLDIQSGLRYHMT